MRDKNNFIEKISKNENIIHKITSNKQDKEDLYQEIVLNLWKAFANSRGKSKFESLLKD